MSQNLPTIAIVTPSYNQAKFLEQTLASVVNQGYPKLHYSVMDGGSTDGSKEIIVKYAKQIDHWQSEKDGGQSAAIAIGFTKSQSEIMGWLNSDDFLLPGSLELIGSFFAKNPDIEAVSCGCLSVNAESQRVKDGFGYTTRGVAASYDRFRFLETQDGVFQPATFWRRRAYDAVGGLDPSLQFTLDLDLFTKLARRRRFAKLSHFVACYRWHGESKTTRMQEVRTAELAIFRERFNTASLAPYHRLLRYYQFRVPSLVRKALLRSADVISSDPSISLVGKIHANS